MFLNPHGIDMQLLLQILRTTDDYGNYFVLVGDSEQSDVAFTSHLDTVARPSSKAPDVGMTNGWVLFVKNPQEADCLGADCGAGVYLMLEMLKRGVHGRYCFFVDEEVGCEGSAADWSKRQANMDHPDGYWVPYSWDLVPPGCWALPARPAPCAKEAGSPGREVLESRSGLALSIVSE